MCFVLNFFSITCFGTLLEGNFVDSLAGLLTQGPLRARLEVIPENGHEAAAFSHAPRDYRAAGASLEVLRLKL